jgi:hypothetical protein
MITVNLPMSFRDLIITKKAIEDLSMDNEIKKELLTRIDKVLTRYYKKEKRLMKNK